MYGIMDKSTEGGLKSLGNIMTVRKSKNPPEQREQLQNSETVRGRSLLLKGVRAKDLALSENQARALSEK